MRCSGKTTQKNVQLATNYYTALELVEMFGNSDNDLVFSRMENGRSKYYTVEDTGSNFEKVSALLRNFDPDKEYLGVTLHKGDNLKVVLDKFGFYQNVLIRGNKKFIVNIV